MRRMAPGERLDSRQRRLMSRFKNERKYWSPIWEQLLKSDTDFFEHFLNISSHPFVRGPLPLKVKELILIAINVAATHLYEPGLRIHIRNALRAGATRAEIVEVFELASLIGMHSCTFGMPILDEEFKSFTSTDTKKRK